MLNRRRIVALIPARGGSKGVHRKNVQTFLGEPLMVHSINYAQECQLVDDVFVSTEDTEIGELAEKHAAKVIWRPFDLAGDQSTTEAAIGHALQDLNKRGAGCDIVVLLQPTSPLRPPDSLRTALKAFDTGGYDSMLSISPTHRFFWRIKEDQALPEYNFMSRPRRQDMQTDEIRYLENGSLYIFSTRHFEQVGNRLGGKIGYTLFDEQYSHEIDTWDDLRYLEQLAKRLEQAE